MTTSTSPSEPRRKSKYRPASCGPSWGIDPSGHDQPLRSLALSAQQRPFVTHDMREHVIVDAGDIDHHRPPTAALSRPMLRESNGTRGSPEGTMREPQRRVWDPIFTRAFTNRS